MNQTKIISAVGLAVAGLVLVGGGCASSDSSTNSSTKTTATNAATTLNANAKTNATTATVNAATNTATNAAVVQPTINLVSPTDGATVATTADVTVAITGFTLAPDAVGKANVAGEGHYHVMVDGVYFAPGAAATTSLKNLTVGEHEIYVTVENNDHTDLDPVVKSEPVTVTVE